MSLTAKEIISISEKFWNKNPPPLREETKGVFIPHWEPMVDAVYPNKNTELDLYIANFLLGCFDGDIGLIAVRRYPFPYVSVTQADLEIIKSWPEYKTDQELSAWSRSQTGRDWFSLVPKYVGWHQYTNKCKQYFDRDTFPLEGEAVIYEVANSSIAHSKMWVAPQFFNPELFNKNGRVKRHNRGGEFLEWQQIVRQGLLS